jgi:hypothetical protein
VLATVTSFRMSPKRTTSPGRKERKTGLMGALRSLTAFSEKVSNEMEHMRELEETLAKTLLTMSTAAAASASASTESTSIPFDGRSASPSSRVGAAAYVTSSGQQQALRSPRGIATPRVLTFPGLDTTGLASARSLGATMPGSPRTLVASATSGRLGLKAALECVAAAATAALGSTQAQENAAALGAAGESTKVTVVAGVPESSTELTQEDREAEHELLLVNAVNASGRHLSQASLGIVQWLMSVRAALDQMAVCAAAVKDTVTVTQADAAIKGHHDDLLAELANKTSAVTELTAELARRDALIQEQKGRADTAEATVAQLTASLDTTRQAATQSQAALTSECAGLQARAAALDDLVSKQRHDFSVSQQSLSTVRNELAVTTERLAAAETQTALLTAQLEQLRSSTQMGSKAAETSAASASVAAGNRVAELELELAAVRRQLQVQNSQFAALSISSSGPNEHTASASAPSSDNTQSAAATSVMSLTAAMEVQSMPLTATNRLHQQDLSAMQMYLDAEKRRSAIAQQFLDDFKVEHDSRNAKLTADRAKWKADAKVLLKQISELKRLPTWSGIDPANNSRRVLLKHVKQALDACATEAQEEAVALGNTNSWLRDRTQMLTFLSNTLTQARALLSSNAGGAPGGGSGTGTGKADNTNGNNIANLASDPQRLLEFWRTDSSSAGVVSNLSQRFEAIDLGKQRAINGRDSDGGADALVSYVTVARDVMEFLQHSLEAYFDSTVGISLSQLAQRTQPPGRSAAGALLSLPPETHFSNPVPTLVSVSKSTRAAHVSKGGARSQLLPGGGGGNDSDIGRSASRSPTKAGNQAFRAHQQDIDMEATTNSVQLFAALQKESADHLRRLLDATHEGDATDQTDQDNGRRHRRKEGAREVLSTRIDEIDEDDLSSLGGTDEAIGLGLGHRAPRINNKSSKPDKKPSREASKPTSPQRQRDSHGFHQHDMHGDQHPPMLYTFVNGFPIPVNVAHPGTSINAGQPFPPYVLPQYAHQYPYHHAPQLGYGLPMSMHPPLMPQHVTYTTAAAVEHPVYRHSSSHLRRSSRKYKPLTSPAGVAYSVTTTSSDAVYGADNEGKSSLESLEDSSANAADTTRVSAARGGPQAHAAARHSKGALLASPYLPRRPRDLERPAQKKQDKNDRKQPVESRAAPVAADNITDSFPKAAVLSQRFADHLSRWADDAEDVRRRMRAHSTWLQQLKLKMTASTVGSVPENSMTAARYNSSTTAPTMLPDVAVLPAARLVGLDPHPSAGSFDTNDFHSGSAVQAHIAAGTEADASLEQSPKSS